MPSNGRIFIPVFADGKTTWYQIGMVQDYYPSVYEQLDSARRIRIEMQESENKMEVDKEEASRGTSQELDDLAEMLGDTKLEAEDQRMTD